MYQALQASFYMGSCRFHPTCSHYAVEAFERRGFWMGLFLTTYRLLRCQPFCKGGWDPVPLDPVPVNDSLSRKIEARKQSETKIIHSHFLGVTFE